MTLLQDQHRAHIARQRRLGTLPARKTKQTKDSAPPPDPPGPPLQPDRDWLNVATRDFNTELTIADIQRAVLRALPHRSCRHDRRRPE